LENVWMMTYLWLLATHNPHCEELGGTPQRMGQRKPGPIYLMRPGLTSNLKRCFCHA
jgi:hypothetical protein